MPNMMSVRAMACLGNTHAHRWNHAHARVCTRTMTLSCADHFVLSDRPWSPEIDPSVDSDVSSTRDSARDEELEVMRNQLERSYWGGMPQ